MSSDRYHKAAKDGLLDVLREANRREVNAKDIDGMTPVLWTAFDGRLDALRLLVGRGGDPDKSDQFGNTALHLAAAKGHIHCVDFLVKFGVNLYSLDIDHHTAKDLAAINNRDDILRYLDTATSNLELTDKKKSKAHKEAAEKHCEKRIKEYKKKQLKIEQNFEASAAEQQQQQLQYAKGTNADTNSTMPHRPSTVLDWKQRLWSSSQGNLKQALARENNQQHQQQQPNNLQPMNATKFSALVGGTISGPRGTVQRRAFKAKQQQHMPGIGMSEFKIGEIDTSSGKRSVRSLQGVQRDSEVIYVGTFSSNLDAGKRGKITDVFDVNNGVGGLVINEQDEEIGDDVNDETGRGSGSGDGSSIRSGSGSGGINGRGGGSGSGNSIIRSFSQPDFLANNQVSEEVLMQRPSGLFDRPMLGSLAFRRSVTAALSELNPDTSSVASSNESSSRKAKVIKPRTHLVISDSDSNDESDSSDDEAEDGSTPLERFLAAWGLEEHLHIFQKQQIDLDILMLLTESDLKSLNLPLGPFRKLAIAIQERKNALTNPGPIHDSRL